MRGTEDAPGASVVVASFSGEASLRRCLESLYPQAAAAEVIAAVAGGAGAHLKGLFPLVRFLEAPPETTVFSLRSLGVARARGRLVALTEDHCTVAPDWLERLASAHAAGHAVVGGPVESGLPGIRDWALFLVEYGTLLPPLPAGPARALSGVNVAYDAEALRACRSTWEHAFRENEVHDVLAPSHGLHRVEGAWVRSHLRMPLREAMKHLQDGGRHYGAHRRSCSGPVTRVLLALAAPAVPGVLLWRVVKAVARRRPQRLPALLLGLPYVIALLAAWSTGEAAGYVLPPPPPCPVQGRA